MTDVGPHAEIARVVVVANRVPPRPLAGGPPSVGGLVSALQPALEERGGLWFGWSGEAGDPNASSRSRVEGGVEYVTVDLDAREVQQYYEGFCNGTLWPLMHGLDEHAHVSEPEYEVWRKVNGRFAQRLLPLLRPDDLVWVHDYHLIVLGSLLRAAGWEGRLGYFHHIPIPPEQYWQQIPHASEIAAAFGAYDLVGVQTERDRRRLTTYIPESSPSVVALPIGIDPVRIRDAAAKYPDDPFASIRRGRKVLFGLDRLDYTKGIPGRLEAFALLLAAGPEFAAEAVLAQWSAPSREGVSEYQAERRTVERLAARIEADWPGGEVLSLRIETLPPEIASAALREADVCLVTSLADGMNLVAKEFVAVQGAENPGVLILTDGCGAAEEMHEALIVPSGDVPALAEAIQVALLMSSDERRRRWEALRARVEAGDASSWCHRFLSLLDIDTT